MTCCLAIATTLTSNTWCKVARDQRFSYLTVHSSGHLNCSECFLTTRKILAPASGTGMHARFFAALRNGTALGPFQLSLEFPFNGPSNRSVVLHCHHCCFAEFPTSMLKFSIIYIMCFCPSPNLTLICTRERLPHRSCYCLKHHLRQLRSLCNCQQCCDGFRVRYDQGGCYQLYGSNETLLYSENLVRDPKKCGAHFHVESYQHGECEQLSQFRTEHTTFIHQKYGRIPFRNSDWL